jgi:uncharacterized repeat protein (TIGR02543 family)
MIGIAADEENPGYKNIILQPSVTDRIDYAKGSYKSFYGKIESGWEVDSNGNLTSYKTVVPANTTATLYLPMSEIGKVTDLYQAQYVGQTIHNGVPVAEFRMLSGGFEFTVAANGDIIATYADGYIIPPLPVFNVNFDTDGGNDIEPALVQYGDKALRPEDPSRFGYTFAGWTLNGTVFDFDSTINRDITLLATWEPIPITSIRINAIAIVTVSRSEARRFAVTLNEDASDDRIVWTTANEALATVDEDGIVTVKNVIGTVVLTATDPLSGRSHSVLLRIAS